MSQPATVDLDINGATAVLTLNQPETRNALSMQMRADLLERLQEARSNQAVRAIVLAAKGSAFCAGGDLKTLSTETAASMLERQFNVQNLIRTIMTGYTPVIAAVEGAAMGTGFSLALAWTSSWPEPMRGSAPCSAS
jgi:2-(1,2-epoxy-1,2-dihydrophenyl)acetyl-CoA isomerase